MHFVLILDVNIFLSSLDRNSIRSRYLKEVNVFSWNLNLLFHEELYTHITNFSTITIRIQ